MSFTVLDEIDRIAAEHGATVAQVALTWQLGLPWVTAPIVGANSVAQLSELGGACEVKLPAPEMERLNAVSSGE